MTEVRGTLLKGTQSVAGYFFSVALLGESRARRRILELWQSRSQLYRVPRGYVLILGEPHWVDVATALGFPLVEHQGIFASVILRPCEKTSLGLRQGDWVLVWGGRAEKLNLTSDCQIHASKWLDLRAYPVVTVSSLGCPPTVTIQQPEKAKVEALANVVQSRQDKGIRELIKAMSQTGQPDQNLPRRGRPTWAQRGVNWVLNNNRLKASHPSSGETTRQPKGDLSRSQPSLLTRLFLKLGASLLYQKQHAKFLGRMLDLFQQGNLEEALRYAVPLAGNAEPSDHPHLGFLKPKNVLNLGQKQVSSSGGSLLFGDHFYQHLKERYQQAFQMLDSKGQTEMAAYVLATLLNQPERAVRYLEEKGKLHKAVEVAESRNLDPGWVIRLLMTLGNRDRALLWARRTGAFFPALQMLEQRDKKAAHLWRALWARHLAHSGDYEAAVNVAWPVPKLHRVAATWIDLALAGGGTGAMRMLAKSLSLRPDDCDSSIQMIKELLIQKDRVATRNRHVFAESLLDVPDSETVRWSAIVLMRALLLDLAEQPSADFDELLKKLNKKAIGGGMTAELKVLSQIPAAPARMVASRQPPREHFLNERGAAPIYDSLLTEDGRLLLALGEAGVRYVSRGRKRLYSAEKPAYRLIPSDRGNQVIALAPRDDWLELTRVDLLRRSSQSWGMLPDSTYAKDYDGGHWYYHQGRALSALDVHQPKFAEIWRVSELPGEVLQVVRDANQLHLLIRVEPKTLELDGTQSPQNWEQWIYKLPEHRLEKRQSLEWQEEPPFWDMDQNADLVVYQNQEQEADPSMVEIGFFKQGRYRRKWAYSISGSLENLQHQGGVVLLQTRTEEGGTLHLLQASVGDALARVHFYGNVQMRFTPDGVLIAHELGCIYLLEKDTLELRCLLRL